MKGIEPILYRIMMEGIEPILYRIMMEGINIMMEGIRSVFKLISEKNETS